MNRHGIIFLLFVLFLFLLGDFHKLNGIEYPLLRILLELIGIVLIIVLILHKKELLDENQRKLVDYFMKIKKINK